MNSKNESPTTASNQINPFSDPGASKKPLLLYITLTFIITWTCWIIAMKYLVKNEYPIPSLLNFQSRYETGFANSTQRFYTYLFICGTLGPMISAIITTLIFYKWDGLKALLRRMVFFKVPIKWYLIIIVIPLLLALINLLIGLVFGGNFDDSFQFPTPWYLIGLMILSQIFTSGLEEPGWRGFATPEMQKFTSAENTGYLVGIIWAIWHFPFLIYLYAIEMKMQGYLIVLSLIGYIALIVPMAIILVWVYNNTESVIVLILAHAFNNLIPFFVMGGVIDSSGGFTIAIASWILAGYLSKRYGKISLKKQET